jgi:hypothetical protein
MRAANVIEVHPSVPVNSVPELIAYAKATLCRQLVEADIRPKEAASRYDPTRSCAVQEWCSAN